MKSHLLIGRLSLCVGLSFWMAIPVYSRGFCGGGRGGGRGGFDRGGDRGGMDRGGMDHGGFSRSGDNSGGRQDRNGFNNSGFNSDRSGGNDSGRFDQGGQGRQGGYNQGSDGRFQQGDHKDGYNGGMDDWGNRNGRPVTNPVTNPSGHPTFGGGFGNIPSREGGNNHEQFPGAFGGGSTWHNGANSLGHNGDVHNWNNHDLNVQGQSVRNSFNHVGNNYNFNSFGGYHNGGWGGYPIYGFNSAAAWTMFGVGTATSVLSFLGIAMLVSSNGKSSKNSTATAQPVSYGNVTYNYGNVYVDGQPAGSSQQFYQQSMALASSGYALQQNTAAGGAGTSYSGANNPSTAAPVNTSAAIPAANLPNANEWKPLGVFALAQPGQKDANMLLQLQINADGKITGEYLNQLTGETSPVFGALDKKTQRVSWTIGKNTQSVFDAGLGDLMKKESTVLVHYGPDSTERMALIRMEKPNGLGGSETKTSNAASNLKLALLRT